MLLLARNIQADQTSNSVGPFTILPNRLVEVFIVENPGGSIDVQGFGVTWHPVSYTTDEGNSLRLCGVLSGDIPAEDSLTIQTLDGEENPIEWWHCFVTVVMHDASVVTSNGGLDAYVQAVRSGSQEFGPWPNELAPLQEGNIVSGFSSIAGATLTSVSESISIVEGTETPLNLFFDFYLVAFSSETHEGEFVWSGGFNSRMNVAELSCSEPVEPPPPPEPPPPRMSGFPLNVKQLHSGHSLTDPGFHPYPGPYRFLLWDHLGATFEHIEKSTMPGAGLQWRWEHENEISPSARYDIADWELLVITEGVPLPANAVSAEYLSLYAVNAWEEGNDEVGTPTMLWATWTDLGEDWRDELDEYVERWEAMAWAATLALPEGAPPVYIIPGNLMMARFFDDIEEELFPGVTNISQLFEDNIHPNDLGAYAWAMIHYACIYCASPVGLPRDIWGDNNGTGNDGTDPPVIPSPEQALYIQETVWEIVTSYAWTGVTETAEPQASPIGLFLGFNF